MARAFEWGARRIRKKSYYKGFPREVPINLLQPCGRIENPLVFSTIYCETPQTHRAARAFQPIFSRYPRSSPIPISCFRAIHRLDRANSVVSCAVVFHQPTKAHFHITKLVLDHAKRMLDLGTRLSFAILDPALVLVEQAALIEHGIGLRRAAICQITLRLSCSSRFSTPV